MVETGSPETDLFGRFAEALSGKNIIANLRNGLIGEDAFVPGPGGPHKLIYADYVASGRALSQIENHIATLVLPYYSNAHSEASFCGQVMNRLQIQARRIVAQSCGAGPEHAVIFTGAGATAGLSRLAALFGIEDAIGRGERPVVLIGPYEHHSNILPWRESGAEVVEIPEGDRGGPDIGHLEKKLADLSGRLVIGAYSAASNVTGIVSDVGRITGLLKAHGALSVWDYAGGGPYLPVDMSLGMDAVAISPHKFIGGPGASGVLILRRDAVTRTVPTAPGGGTVRFASPWAHDYADDVVVREESGTPNVIGNLRAALSFMVKDAIGDVAIARRLQTLRQRAWEAWAATPGLEILGNPRADHVLPIFSFRVVDGSSRIVHPQLVCRILSDFFGIQARGGCACAGPYAHRLLALDREASDRIRRSVLKGHEIDKPGWTRLGFSVLMDDAKADAIIGAVNEIARDPARFTDAYCVDVKNARFQLENA